MWHTPSLSHTVRAAKCPTFSETWFLSSLSFPVRSESTIERCHGFYLSVHLLFRGSSHYLYTLCNRRHSRRLAAVSQLMFNLKRLCSWRYRGSCVNQMYTHTHIRTRGTISMSWKKEKGELGKVGVCLVGLCSFQDLFLMVIVYNTSRLGDTQKRKYVCTQPHLTNTDIW